LYRISAPTPAEIWRFFLNRVKIRLRRNIRRSRIFGRIWKTVRNAILISNNKPRSIGLSHLSRDLAKCNINTTQCITAADSVLGNRGATSEKKQYTETHHGSTSLFNH